MAEFSPTKLNPANMNRGQGTYGEGSTFDVEDWNETINGVLYADENSETAIERVNELEELIVEGQGTAVYVANVPAVRINFTTDPQTQIDNLNTQITNLPSFSTIYPIGAIYVSLTSTSPASLFGGSWTRILGRALVAAGVSDATYTAGTTGGASTVTLSENQMPAHGHDTILYVDPNGNYQTTRPNQLIGNGNYEGTVGTRGNRIAAGDYVGGGQSHQNMPPYYVVYMWRRTA